MKAKIFSCIIKYLPVLLGACSCLSASAQLNWKSRGVLYEDKNIAVEIEYAAGSDPCSPGQQASQYRYRIIRLTGSQRFYINWRFDYFNCDHQLKTHANSLLITKTVKRGDVILPDDNQFSAFRVANYFNNVKKSAELPKVTSYEPKYSASLEPKAITGKLDISIGETATLQLLGGYLAPNAAWRWYEGSCNGPAIGSGTTLKLQPKKTTTYAVRAEGGSETICLLATVTVSQLSLMPVGIDGRLQICAGERNVRLLVNGGKLIADAKWVWYQDECSGRPVGVGNSIEVSPERTTTYYVRAEGVAGHTACQDHRVTVIAGSKPADGIDGVEKIALGDGFTLSVRGGELAPDAKWIWYAGTNADKMRVGEGSSFSVGAASTGETYYVRAEGVCFKSAFTAKTVRVVNPAKPLNGAAITARPVTFFINGGVVASDVNQLSGLNNYVATIGGGKNVGWFLRAKISGVQTKAGYETAGWQIIDYDQPGYYRYNGQVASKRAAYTGGGYFGGKHWAIYIGGGYGTRELLYGLEQYAYGDSFSAASSWVKNTAASYTGVELEGGLLLKAGFFNIMGGASTIQGKYTDYNLGLGFNF